MALEQAWEFIKGVRTSAHPLGPQGSMGRERAEGLHGEAAQENPNLTCDSCGEEYGPGESCLCDRQAASTGKQQAIGAGRKYPNDRWGDWYEASERGPRVRTVPTSKEPRLDTRVTPWAPDSKFDTRKETDKFSGGFRRVEIDPSIWLDEQRHLGRGRQ